MATIHGAARTALIAAFSAAGRVSSSGSAALALGIEFQAFGSGFSLISVTPASLVLASASHPSLTLTPAPAESLTLVPA